MLLASQFNSVRNTPRKPKREMIAAVEGAHKFPIVKSRIAARNTLDYTDAVGVRRIRLHNTDILAIKPDGSFIVDTGGWNTHTTRDRLNSFLPNGWRVFTSKGSIHLAHGEDSVVFHQTITVGKAGVVKSDVTPVADEKLKKLIDNYMTVFRKRGLPKVEESGGDPWVFTTTYKDVMLDWLKNRYVFRTMIVLAFRHAGVADGGIALYLADYDRKGLDKFAYARIRRYIRFCLGLAT